MNGKRAGVAVSLITVLAFCVLSSGCRHTEGQYTELMARLDRGIEGKGLSTNTIAANEASSQPEVHTVSLSRQIDRAWLQPPTNLFTLGPGDRIEIEIIGEPASRTTTERPPCERRCAAVSPARPPPTTATSTSTVATLTSSGRCRAAPRPERAAPGA